MALVFSLSNFSIYSKSTSQAIYSINLALSPLRPSMISYLLFNFLGFNGTEWDFPPAIYI